MLSGCGGGGSSSGISGTIANTYPTRTYSSRVALATGQAGNLTLTPQIGGTETGTLEVVTTNPDVTQAVIPLTGTYNTGSGSFTINGSASGYTASIVGTMLLSTSGLDGNFTVTLNNNTYSGTLAGAANSMTASIPNVSGAITDINGTPVLNATVTFNGTTTTSGQSGLYSLPIGSSTASIKTVSASRVVNGVTWSGTNNFILNSGSSAANVQIPIYNPALNGTISGKVTNATGAAVSGAKISIGAAAPSSAKFAFNTLGSISAYTATDGTFSVNLPAATNYTIVASYAGQTNANAQGVTVTAGTTLTRNFTLAAASTGSYNLPAITNFTGLSITAPINPTRAVGSTGIDSGILAVRNYLLRRRGIVLKHAAASSRIVMKAVPATRSAPAGYVIQDILEWDYTAYDALYGYAVLRSLNDTSNFATYATIQDPLAERFSDGDNALTVGSFYYYNIVRVDTNLNDGAVDAVNNVILRPLAPIVATAPLSGATQTLPLFQWQSVTYGINYTIVVYDQYPSPVDPNNTAQATQPIWSKSVTNANALVYQGPALVSGHTYYWAVAADDLQDPTSPNYDTTISTLSSFIVP